MQPSKIRKLSRIIHLIAAIAIGTFVYSPWRLEPGFIGFMQWIVIPSVSLTGLALWKPLLFSKKSKEQ